MKIVIPIGGQRYFSDIEINDYQAFLGVDFLVLQEDIEQWRAFLGGVDKPLVEAFASRYVQLEPANAPPDEVPPTEAPSVQPPPSDQPQVVIVLVNKQDEYVDIQNTGSVPVDLAGWNLVSERGNQECPLNGIIQPGQVLRIWALAKDVGNGGFNCGSQESGVWNNSEPDPAVLYNANKVEVFRVEQ